MKSGERLKTCHRPHPRSYVMRWIKRDVQNELSLGYSSSYFSEHGENKRRCSLHNSNQRFKVGWSNRGEKVKILSSSSSSSSFRNGLREVTRMSLRYFLSTRAKLT